MTHRYLLPLIACLLTPSVFADEHPDSCANATTQADMNQCAARQSQAADKQLNAVYQQITQRLKARPDARQQLVKAQRAWLAFRDGECGFAASGVKGGSAYPLVYGQCVTAQNTARTEALKVYLKCQEGDMGCPVPGQ